MIALTETLTLNPVAVDFGFELTRPAALTDPHPLLQHPSRRSCGMTRRWRSSTRWRRRTWRSAAG
jgi:hypothetical protein